MSCGRVIASRSVVAPAVGSPQHGLAHFGGVIVGGDRRGRLLGFPTANIDVAVGNPVPADGVYACVVRFAPAVGAGAVRAPAVGAVAAAGIDAADDGVELFGATVSIGNNPTFDDVPDRRVEAYVHDLSADLYGRTVSVWVVGHLRAMVRFETPDALIHQTAADVDDSRRLLASASGLGLPDLGSSGQAANVPQEGRRSDRSCGAWGPSAPGA
ncbi:riboflavin kinase [Plantibacter sp. YIM 135347]|uniref:riboflavin kinase n=1 Tax=Plantibacter sp. YIM 135347 TaxID=3423919 RepID=UPI003D34B992